MLPKFKKNAFADKVNNTVKSGTLQKTLAGVLIAGNVVSASTQIPSVDMQFVEDLMNNKTSVVALQPNDNKFLLAYHGSHSSHESHESHQSHQSSSY